MAFLEYSCQAHVSQCFFSAFSWPGFWGYLDHYICKYKNLYLSNIHTQLRHDRSERNLEPSMRSAVSDPCDVTKAHVDTPLVRKTATSRASSAENNSNISHLINPKN